MLWPVIGKLCLLLLFLIVNVLLLLLSLSCRRTFPPFGGVAVALTRAFLTSGSGRVGWL